MFIIMCIQVLLGIGVHWIKVKRHRFMTVSGRGPSNFIHMALGVFCMGLGFATVWTGKRDTTSVLCLGQEHSLVRPDMLLIPEALTVGTTLAVPSQCQNGGG